MSQPDKWYWIEADCADSQSSNHNSQG